MLSNCDLDNTCKTCGYWIEVSEDIFDGKLVVKGVCKYPLFMSNVLIDSVCVLHSRGVCE
jgi:hypothetical protein